jgi:Uma2 family endonuclease
MSTRTLQTFEQFEQFQDDGMKHELLKGEHIVLPPAKVRHGRIQQKLSDVLRPYVHQHKLGEVHIEHGFKLAADTWLEPDVSFVREAQIQVTDLDGYYEGSPAVAIEVVSDSNTPAKLNLKKELYFTHGSEEVWIVYPKTRTVRQHYPDGTSKTVVEGELQSDLFPGWSTPVASLFPGP